MKETKHINLAGCALIIDEDAATTLSEYLRQIEDHLQASDSKEEIMRDIEARIVELLRQHLNYSHAEVADIRMVEDVMRQLGTPEVITDGEESSAADGIEEATVVDENAEAEPQADTTSDATKETNTARHPKRLYRDADDQKVAGVCAGIATYFGVDPIWLRLLLVLSVLFYGCGIMLYLLLWLIVPLADSTARKLEQQGIDPSAENIRQEVERQKEHTSGRPQVRKRNSGSSVAGGCLITLGLIIASPLLIVLLVLAIVAICMVMATPMIVTELGMPTDWTLSLGALFGLVLMIFLIPVVVLIVWSTHQNKSDKPLNKWFWIVALLLWIASIVGVKFSAVHVVRGAEGFDEDAFRQRIDSIMSPYTDVDDVEPASVVGTDVWTGAE